MTAPAGPKHTERIPTHIAESYAGRGVVHGAWRDVVRDLAVDLVAARAQLAARPDPAAVVMATLAHVVGVSEARMSKWTAGHMFAVDNEALAAIIEVATKGPTP